MAVRRSWNFQKENQGLTLTELEATWGVDNVQKGLKRGDIRINERGMYVIKRENEKFTDAQSDVKKIELTEEMKPEDALQKFNDRSWMEWCVEDSSTGKQHATCESVQTKSSKKSRPKAFATAIMTDTDMQNLQSSYDMCNQSLRESKRNARQLREATCLGH